MARILTGLQSSGDPHIGNYFGMIKPALKLQDMGKHECFYFIADLHSFTSNKDGKLFAQNQKNCVLDWLALGIDPEKSVFYRQSDIRAHTEMMWYLLCFTPMGLLERAHSFKDKKANGMETNVGLFTYPMLMTADILLYDAEIIPVGKDQKQHVEMARDIAQKMNHHFNSELFVLPEPQIEELVQTIEGVDGQKMSKSYGNTIPIFGTEKEIKKKVMSIQTQTVKLGDPIDPALCRVFAFHKLFENPNLVKLENQYRNGEIGFGDSKKQLFELIWEYFASARARRKKLEKDDAEIEKILRKGAEKAFCIAEMKLEKIRKKFGLEGKHLI
ncbi:tryptophan--tRNA ligase [Candidatus Gracilibacteria bacterium]|nr:tryptophan--tRNA ligase [Candidatus Gracilibacteria bacterium]